MPSEPGATDSILAGMEPTPLPVRRFGFRKIFIGPSGIRAGWRLALFILLFLSLQYVLLQRGMRLIPGAAEIARQAQVGGVLTPQFELVFESAILLVALLASTIMSRIEKRSLGVYGIPRRGAFGRLFWQGALFGLAFETVEMLAISALGGFSFGTLALGGFALFKFAFLWAISFVLVGLFEEFLFRGYA